MSKRSFVPQRLPSARTRLRAIALAALAIDSSRHSDTSTQESSSPADDDDTTSSSSHSSSSSSSRDSLPPVPPAEQPGPAHIHRLQSTDIFPRAPLFDLQAPPADLQFTSNYRQIIAQTIAPHDMYSGGRWSREMDPLVFLRSTASRATSDTTMMTYHNLPYQPARYPPPPEDQEVFGPYITIYLPFRIESPWVEQPHSWNIPLPTSVRDLQGYTDELGRWIRRIEDILSNTPWSMERLKPLRDRLVELCDRAIIVGSTEEESGGVI